MKDDKLRDEAAKLIGLFLFEFTQLDMHLGLCLVWTNHGQQLNQLTRKFEEKPFSCRLNFLEKHVDKNLDQSSEVFKKYMNWISKADEVRKKRNQLFHGRYGFLEHEGCVANVIGLPTSPNQYETMYTIEELTSLVEQTKNLLIELNHIRKIHPI